MAVSTFTANGNVITSTTQKKFGTTSAYFDGTSDYITADTLTDFNFGSGDWTVEWFEYRTRNGDAESTISTRDGSDWRMILNYPDPTGNATNHYFKCTDSTQVSWAYKTGGLPTLNAWTHYAVVRYGSHIYTYIDGTRVNDNTSIGTKSIVAPTSFRIGRKYNDGSAGYQGYIDEMRISKGIARYTGSTLTVPTSEYSADSYDIALLHMNGDNNGTTFTNSAGEITLTSTTPQDNSILQSVSTNLVINFNGSTSAGAGNIVIYNSADDSVFQTIAANSGNVTINGTQVTVTHNNFTTGNSYYILIDATAFTSYPGITSKTTWNFTVDTFLDTLSPTNGSIDISTTANLVFTSLVNMQAGSGNIVIKKYSDDSTVETITANDAKINYNNKVITINPDTTLTDTTKYYVTIASGAFQDTNNNNYPGFSNKDVWTFTTADTTGPVISSTDPTNSSTGVYKTTNLILNWNENVTAVANKYVTIKKYSDDSTVESIAANDSKITVSNSQITINPTNDLNFETQYYVVIDAGAFKDAKDNGNLAISSKDTWSFTTIAESIKIIPFDTYKEYSTGDDYSGDIFTPYKGSVTSYLSTTITYITKVYVNGSWQLVPCKIYYNGSWQTISPKIYNGGNWQT